MMPENPSLETAPIRPVIKRLEMKLGDATDFEIDVHFNDELPFMILCKRCGMAYIRQWRQQRLRYRHLNTAPGECTAPMHAEVSPFRVLHEAMTRIIGIPMPNATILERLKACVVMAWVDYNPSPTVIVDVTIPAEEERRCAQSPFEAPDRR
jgi:hypothetical protein